MATWSAKNVSAENVKHAHQKHAENGALTVGRNYESNGSGMETGLYRSSDSLGGGHHSELGVVGMDCPNHGGAYDCTPFCNLCEGAQEIGGSNE